MRLKFGLSEGPKPPPAADPQRLARQAIRSQAAAREYAERQLLRAEQIIQDLSQKLHAVRLEKGIALEAARMAQTALAQAELLRDNLDESRIASSRNAPEQAGHCLTRMLPWPHHLVNRPKRKDGFPVRSLGLLSRPDLTPAEPRRAAEGMGGAEPPAATRNALSRASMVRMASTGPSPK